MRLPLRHLLLHLLLLSHLLLHLLLLLYIALLHLHLRRIILLLVLLRVLRRLPILLVPVLRLLWRVLGIRPIVVAVLLVVPRIHGRFVKSDVVRSPGIVVCHDIVSVGEVVNEYRVAKFNGNRDWTRAVTCC